MSAEDQPRTLTFHDSQVADFLEEMGAFLEGYLALLDAANPQMDDLLRWDCVVILALRFAAEQPFVQELLAQNAGSQTNSQT